ncbi:hypothetical protein AQ490_23490 [Wenjunlia vitaminophila]|uniref:ABC transporter permease n=1 Tax=Wenjunlia vitaminophila TaxID=76728 RepID=A0A0T6LRW0_WENVI|nr:FtsX-like permease family protein [Wenjunlia vitaminophila]KRV48829.1 hypothetical protein AQ490_23490 [Wenjunlia vitaminophila]
MTVLKTSLRNFFAHKGRMILSGIAVLLSVAFVCGTLVFTDTMDHTFDKLFNDSAADVTISAKEIDDAQDNGKVATVPVTLLEKAKRIEGVKAAYLDVSSDKITVVDSDNDNIGPTSGAPTVGVNWQESDRNPLELSSGRLAKGPGEAVLDKDTADKKDVEIGDTLKVIAIPGTFEVKVTGIASFTATNPGATLVIFDTPTAQAKLLGSTKETVEVDLDAAAGVSNDELKKNVLAALGSDYDVKTQSETADDAADDLGSFFDFMKYAMLAFALVSVIVGIFLIVNTFSMLVTQRTREIGLLRAVGASRKQVNRSVLVEAVLLGVVGSLLGIASGIGLAVGLMKLMGKAGMHLSTSDLTIKVSTPLIGLVLGVVVTVLAAYLPARRAGKVSPMAALRDAGTPADGKSGKVRAALGLLITGVGGAGLVLATTEDDGGVAGQYLGLGILLTLIGFIVIGPLLASVVVRVLGFLGLRVFGAVGRMAERNALRNPRRTGATAAALMIGLALVSGLAVVSSSMVASATDELDKSVGADFIVGSDMGQPLAPQVTQAVVAAKGKLDHITNFRSVNAKVTTPGGKDEKGTLEATDPTYMQDVRTKAVAGDLATVYNTVNTVSVPEGFAEDNELKVGDKLTVAFVEGKTATLRIAAITADDTMLSHGARFISTATMERNLPEDKRPLAEIMLASAKDGQEDQAYTVLKQNLEEYPQVKVRDQADYKKVLEDQVGQLLNLVYGLLGLAIVVAILGVVNTLALSVVERTREIGLIRAIGMSRLQTRRMIRLESVVISLFGAILGLGLGLAWGIAAQKLMELGGLKVLEIPWATIAYVFVGSAVVGLLAAVIPAYRAGRMNVLNAIATD